MKGQYLLRGIRNLMLGGLLVFGVTALASTQANAQARFRGGFRGGGFHTRVFVGPRFGYPYPYWYGYRYGYPYGYYGEYVFGDSVAADSQGYHDGLKTGADDARHERSYDPERSHYFKDAGFGNFAEDYREGFERGYSTGFRS